VDAALDPNNVDKLGNLISRLSLGVQNKKAQFIVISHREILMAKANQVWGVTSDKGVSSLFRLNLDDYRKKMEAEAETASPQVG